MGIIFTRIFLRYIVSMNTPTLSNHIPSVEKPKTIKAKFFIAGTDTDVGKTLVSTVLLYAAQQAGLSTLGLKPVAAGGEKTENGLQENSVQNEDALNLMTYSSIKLPYAQVNPVCLTEAIAPHIAAQREGRTLRVDRVLGFCRGALMSKAEFSLVEGAGGWRVPLNRTETMADLAKGLNIPVILVVGIKLGCLSHALLTAEAMRRDGVRIAGWVATHLQADMPVASENVETLTQMLDFPLLLELPFSVPPSIETFSKSVDIHKLLESVGS